MAATFISSTYVNTVERRETEMISPVHREAYFLSPVERSGRPLPSPYLIRPLSAIPPGFNVRYAGWKLPSDAWKAWTNRMHSKYGHLWKQAGILKPILNSCCKIHRNDKVIAGFAEKWNETTNTFVFPWGEATVTLEDMVVIGGYSVLGAPVFSTIDARHPDSDLMKAQKALELERRKLNRGSNHKVLQSDWMKTFMNKGSPYEHEAYLALWLSRFIFPKYPQSETVGSHVLPLAVLLAKGNRIALAPAVLASIYSSLSKMKDAIASNSSHVSVSAPLQLLQIWIWERFPNMRPYPIVQVLNPGEPWFRRWDSAKTRPPSDVTKAIDDAGDYFSWRPFYGDVTGNMYADKADLVFISSGVSEGTKVLIRFFRHSELVGMDDDWGVMYKQYLPHRVARQFGYDQDVPAPVPRFTSDKDEAWRNYSRAVSDVWLYIPNGVYRAGMSARYQRWWNGYAP